jgi:hypothetical protein
MNSMFGCYGAVAMAAAVQISAATLADGQPQSAAGARPQPSSNNQSGAPAESPGDDVTAALELPVLYVTSVEILQTASDPKIDVVSVTGLVSSDGWTAPQLVPTYAGKPFDDVVDLQFIATAPVQSQLATGFVAVSAVFSIEPIPA